MGVRHRIWLAEPRCICIGNIRAATGRSKKRGLITRAHEAGHPGEYVMGREGSNLLPAL